MEKLIEEYGTTMLYMVVGAFMIALVLAFYQPGGVLNGIIRNFMGGLTG